jgi:hypothetical protein
MLKKDREARNRLPTDELFQTLSHAIRRRVISQLASVEPASQLPVEDVDFPESDGTVNLCLYHNHLPKLDAVDIIDWDRNDGLIERGEHFPEVADFLETVAEIRDEIPAT